MEVVMSNTNLTANEPRNSSPTSINRRNARLCDLVNLVLGLVLISTPWLFGIAPGTQATALIGGGAAIIILSLAALTRFAVWEEWLNLLVSLWLIIYRSCCISNGSRPQGCRSPSVSSLQHSPSAR